MGLLKSALKVACIGIFFLFALGVLVAMIYILGTTIANGGSHKQLHLVNNDVFLFGTSTLDKLDGIGVVLTLDGSSKDSVDLKTLTVSYTTPTHHTDNIYLDEIATGYAWDSWGRQFVVLGNGDDKLDGNESHADGCLEEIRLKLPFPNADANNDLRPVAGENVTLDFKSGADELLRVKFTVPAEITPSTVLTNESVQTSYE